MQIRARPSEPGEEFASLLSNHIHLWLAPYRDARLEPELPALRALLSADERERLERFQLDDDRRRFLVTRAAVRQTLSRYAEVDPSAWRFESNPFGKPAIVHRDPRIRRIEFNLSHTDGLIALAVCVDRWVGVDVESVDRAVSSTELAGRYFAPHEAADIERAPASARTRRFFEYWTLKEAYVKARGQGLSIPLDRFGFHLDERKGLALRTHPTLADHGSDWHLWQGMHEARYLVALCVRRDATGRAPRVSCRMAWSAGAGDMVLTRFPDSWELETQG